MANREGGSTNVATVPWMTSLQDTASNLQQATPQLDTAADVAAAPFLQAQTAPAPFMGRAAPPTPILPPLFERMQLPTLKTAHVDAAPVTTATPAQPVALTLSRVVQTNAFKHSVAVVCVFVISLVVLIIIQPPFTYTDSKEKYKRGHFSVGIAALYALGAACLSAGVMTAVYFATRKRP